MKTLAAGIAILLCFALAGCKPLDLKLIIADIVESASSTGVPAVGLSKTSVSFSALTGGANPTSDTVSITNAGGGTLSGLSVGISYAGGSGWLNASLDVTTAPATLTIQATTGALAAGTYTASVDVSAAAASNSPKSVGVTFTVSNPITRLTADAGTVGLWHLNEGTGQTVADSSSAGWNLTLGDNATVETVDPVWTAAGRFGYGLSFTAAENDYVKSTGLPPAVFSGPNKMTAEFWIKTTNTNTSAMITTGDSFLYMQLEGTGTINATVGGGGNSVYSTTLINDGQWHYIAIVYDGILSGGTLSLYVDGSPEHVRDQRGVLLINPSSWYIGGRPSNTFVDGWMDEVRLSNVARSASEIAANK